MITTERIQLPAEDSVARPDDLSSAVASIVDELKPMFSGLLAAAAITECATRAVQDLLGSICLQALPEMAIRLATVRLQSLSQSQGVSQGVSQSHAAFQGEPAPKAV